MPSDSPKPAKPSDTERQPQAIRMIPFIVGCALFMQMLDATVVATALPAMAATMGTSVIQMNVAITSYLLSVAVFVPVSGWAADRYGARRVFIIAILLFTGSSLMCGLAQNLGQLIVARVLQGLAGAMMVPVGRIIMLRTVPKDQLLKAMAFLSMPALLGPVIGPPLGGFLVTYASWRWIFLINVPVGILGIAMVLYYIRQDFRGAQRALDWVGFLLSGVGLATLVAGFEALGHGMLSATNTVLVLAIGVVCTYCYILHARHTPYPIIDLSLLKLPTFSVATLGGNLCRFAIGANPYLLAILLQVGFGMSPFAAGLITFTGAVGSILMKFVATPIIQRYGFRNVLLVNAFTMGITVALCALFQASTPLWLMMTILIAGGFFRSLQFTAVNTLTYADIKPADMSRASSFAATAQQLGISLGVACSAVTLNLSMVVRGAESLERIDIIWGFVVIGVITMLSAFSFRKLAPHAGASLQGKA
jgi:EmrB/QacA subfamily drug resistance transporter